jgi:hypothetical protein
VWIICFTTNDLADAWRSSFSLNLSLDLSSTDSTVGGVAVVHNPIEMFIRVTDKDAKEFKFDENSSNQVKSDWSLCTVACGGGT